MKEIQNELEMMLKKAGIASWGISLEIEELLDRAYWQGRVDEMNKLKEAQYGY